MPPAGAGGRGTSRRYNGCYHLVTSEGGRAPGAATLGPMRADEFPLPMADGFPIHVRRWRAEQPAPGTVRRVVQVTHGMSEHSGRYARLAAALVGAGFEVWAHDHRGHGESIDVDTPLGHLADEGGFDHMVGDLLAVRAELGRVIAEEEPGSTARVALFAHSMGTFVTQAALALHAPSPWEAVVLAGSDAPGGPRISALRAVARAERRRQGPRGQSPVIDALAFGSFNRAFAPTRTDSDWLTRDPHEVDAFLADPRTGFRLTNQSWVDFLGGHLAIGRTGFGEVAPADLPILLLAGDHDPVGRNGTGVRELDRRMRAAGLREVRLTLYPGARHELVNETNRDQVHDDVITFVGQALR